MAPSILAITGFLAIAYLVGLNSSARANAAKAKFLRNSGLGIKARRRKPPPQGDRIPDDTPKRKAEIARLEALLNKS
jgi:hypothetical protein